MAVHNRFLPAGRIGAENSTCSAADFAQLRRQERPIAAAVELCLPLPVDFIVSASQQVRGTD